jgi:hypothetical protein
MMYRSFQDCGCELPHANDCGCSLVKFVRDDGMSFDDEMSFDVRDVI